MSSKARLLSSFWNHRSLRGARFLLTPLVLPCLLLSAVSLHAQPAQRCPWLNAATASGVLGGPVTVTVAPKGDQGDADCLFVRRVGSTTMSLRINVETVSGPPFSLAAYTAPCESELTPIRYIGNEAFACSLPSNKKSGLSEQVASRVREHAFFVRLSSNEQTADADQMRSTVSKIAEQVAGFLF